MAAMESGIDCSRAPAATSGDYVAHTDCAVLAPAWHRSGTRGQHRQRSSMKARGVLEVGVR